MKNIAFVFAFIIWLFFGWAVLLIVEERSQTSLLEKLTVDNERLAVTIANELNRIRVNLPMFHDISLAKRLLLRGESKDREALNKVLRTTALTAQAKEIFLVNTDGIIVSHGARDYFFTQSVGSVNSKKEYGIGSDVSLKPFFQQAIAGQIAGQITEYYDANDSKNNPERYYFAYPVEFNDKIIGVAVLVTGLREVFAMLNKDTANNLNFLVGMDGVVLASTNKEIDYGIVAPVTVKHRTMLQESRRYGASSLRSLSELSYGDFFENDSITITKKNNERRTYIVARFPVNNSSWFLFSSVDKRVIFSSMLNAGMFYLMFSALLLIAWLYLRHRAATQQHLAEINQQLEHRVENLTSGLKRSNSELYELVTHYKSTQERLEQTQYELLQTARLAALGEISATLNHELSQPALALRAYTENSMKLLARGDYVTVQNNFKEMQGICESMGNIVSTIQTFAKQSSQDMRVASLYDLAYSALPIVTHLIQKSGAQLIMPENGKDVFVRCIPEQLEQVLVNLISNATDAISSKPNARVEIVLGLENDVAKIMIRNNHANVAESHLEKLFDPYYTTKEDGLGIGLALCRRIVEAQDGKISARICVNRDIEFSIALKRYREKLNDPKEVKC